MNKKKKYVVPCMHVYALEASQVLMTSGVENSSTEKLDEETFDWDH